MSSTTTKLKGIVTEITDTKKVSEKFSVREFVIKTDSDYPQEIKFSVFNKNIEKLLNGVSVGDIVDVGYNLKGRRTDSGVFNTIEAWSVFKLSGRPSKQTVKTPDYQSEAKSGGAKPSKVKFPVADDDDMPF